MTLQNNDLFVNTNIGLLILYESTDLYLLNFMNISRHHLREPENTP